MRQDFLQGVDRDLQFAFGDLVTGSSDEQHVTDIIMSFPGWWKEFPSLGVGLFNYFGSAGQQQNIVASIVTQLRSDGYAGQPQAAYNPDGTYTIYPNAVPAEG